MNNSFPLPTAYVVASESQGTLISITSDRSPLAEAPAPPLALDDGSIMPSQPRPSIHINLPPPRAESPPLNLDISRAPWGAYEARIHPFNCTCGCKIEQDNYMQLGNVTNTYMESRTFFYLMLGGSLERNQLERRVYRKKKNRVSQTSEYRRSQKRKVAYKAKKKQQRREQTYNSKKKVTKKVSKKSSK